MSVQPTGASDPEPLVSPPPPSTPRFLGIDVGAETVKLVELVGSPPVLARRFCIEHHKDPAGTLGRLLAELDWAGVSGAACTGRGARLLDLPRVPTKAALARGVREAFPGLEAVTVVSIGAHGFSVLELHPGTQSVYRENSRCSQGTGNFLRQLVERFDLDVAAAAALCAEVEKPATLSGRCPVILKTDMTHLANKGEDRAAILAGLYDAVCENVQVLVKPRLSPPTLLLAGGVCRAARVRANFARFCAEHEMHLHEGGEGLHLEALGAALVAATEARPSATPDVATDRRADQGSRSSAAGPAKLPLLRPTTHAHFDRQPPLRGALDRVHRMPPVRLPDHAVAAGQPGHVAPARVVLGFDIGSTGSKAVAIDAEGRQPLWQGYLNTLGNPVGAARSLAERFLTETGGRHVVTGIGATGSGREIVGSLMSACFGPGPVFVLNEIAAHATGATFFDPEVDTIFEIGGQDAKYVRLDGGRIVDAAMNEACSAGTGSFIEEQGKKFEGVDSVVQLGRIALEAEAGISLGQHCSVFMAEVIDDAVTAGEARPDIVAGIYDSIIQNYLNRVKGNRTVGRRIFCQGMPFAADALAAAVARQTGREVVIPPHPGTIGALGIALLARDQVSGEVDLSRFLSAAVDRKDSFPCPSTRGCGEPGNKCRIDRISATVDGKSRKFVWGGACSLYDKGGRSRKLPDRAPDPFRERAALVDALAERVEAHEGTGPIVALTDEFSLKSLYPFFLSFLGALGFRVRSLRNAGQDVLRRGIEEANVPWCAPMQLFHGAVAKLAEDRPDFLLLPRLRELPRQCGEEHAVTCPIVQAAPDVVRRVAGEVALLSPVLDMGEDNLDSRRFRDSALRLAAELGVKDLDRVSLAFDKGVLAQRDFQEACKRIGREALDFAEAQGLVAVVLLGRPYTLYNDVLNSNVPALLREQGAIAIPVDCYPVDEAAPVFDDLYWGHSQVNLRAAWQIRRSPGVYAVWCSNYSCGPDSFNQHFFSYTMEGRPFATIETDGHSGDAGTKTRLEAFLFCVEADRRRGPTQPTDLKEVESRRATLAEMVKSGETLLIPRMGPGAEIVAALLRAEGVRAEALPMPDHESLRLGRRQTSGKECVPMTITTGSLLQRLEAEADPERRFVFFMPTARGPCRFGVYNLFHKLILERTGNAGRARLVSPDSGDYFKGTSPGFQVRFFAATLAADMLLAGLHHSRPAERRPGAAKEVYERWTRRLVDLAAAAPPRSMAASMSELAGGMFGMRELVKKAAADFAAVVDPGRALPTVAVVGEIYVRLDPFANGHVVEELERRGLRAMLAPFTEWIEYTTLLGVERVKQDRAFAGDDAGGRRLSYELQAAAADKLWAEMAGPLGWAPRTTVDDSLAAAAPYLSKALWGEAVLTLGGPLHEHLHGHIDGVVSVGPHECMPNKIAEAQFALAGEDHGLLSLTLPLTGEAIDAELLDRFAFEVKEKWAGRPRPEPGPAWGSRLRTLRRRVVLDACKLLGVVG